MLLPVARDLLRINCYLHARLAGLTKILSEKPDRQVWKLLADVTLASIILFNRRTGTEVAQLLRRSYRQHMYGHEAMDAGVKCSLRPVEKILLKRWMPRLRLRLVLTLDRLNKPYPILLTQDMVTAIDTLEDTRTNCSIRTKNMFVFACFDQLDSHTNAWYALNPLAHEAGCQHPDMISSSYLRTYLSTVYQVLEMEDRERELLSGHLHIDVHSRKAHYRQPGATEDLAKLACMICMAENGEAQNFDGKKMSEIHVSELDVPIDEAEYTEMYNDVDILDDELAG